MASSKQLFINGAIHTMEQATATATVSALLVENGRVSAVAANAEAADALAVRNPDARRVDLGGRTVVPGFVDAHNHLSISALHPRWADLSVVSDEDELYRLLSEQDAAEPDTPWIRGANWNTMTAALPVDRDLLDGFGFSRPIMVADMSLREGITDSRVSSGACLVQGHALSMSGDDEPDRWGELIAERSRAMLREGITAIHDAACSPDVEQVYQSLARAGQRIPLARPMRADKKTSAARWQFGRRADLVVLEGILDEENPPTVAETWVGGSLVWSAADASNAGQ